MKGFTQVPKSNFVAFSVSPNSNEARNYLGHIVPQAFTVAFYDASGFANSGDCHLVVSLDVAIDEDQSPRATSVAFNFDPGDNYSNTSVPPRLQRWHFEAIEAQFHELLGRALVRCIQTLQFDPQLKKRSSQFVDPHFELAPNWRSASEQVVELSPAALKTLAKETQRLTHRRPNDKELFKKVATIYKAETKRAALNQTRGRQIKEIMAELSIPRGTAEMYVRGAKKAGLIPVNSNSRKPTPTKKRKP